MSEAGVVEIRDVPSAERPPLDEVLEQSFTGVYLRHARRTIGEVQTVRAAYLDGVPVGLSMLKTMEKTAGYVYYIAVGPEHRGKRIGSRLLRDAVSFLTSVGAKEVYASVGEDNVESNALFRGHGFRKTSYGEVSRKYGIIRAINMYRAMFIVPGEILLVLDGPSVSEYTSDEPKG
jgi:ribosomal protein S18 acetylase RimI-like enzyme